MDKFSNINWAAFLLGGLWGFFNKFPLWTFLWVLAFLVANFRIRVGDVFVGGTHGDIGSVDILTLAVGLSGYVLMSMGAIYLALRANHILLRDIQKRGMSLEDETRERAKASAHQHKQLIYGIVYKVYSYTAIGYSVSIGMISEHVLFTLLGIDVLSLAVVLVLAPRLHPRENELYPGDKFYLKLAIMTPAIYRARWKKRTVKYDNWNPFGEDGKGNEKDSNDS